MVTAEIILDTRYKLSTNEYPLKLRVTHNRKQRMWKLNASLTKTQFREVCKKTVPDTLQPLKEKIEKCEEAARSIIASITPFHPEVFDRYITEYLETGSLSIIKTLLPVDGLVIEDMETGRRSQEMPADAAHANRVPVEKGSIPVIKVAPPVSEVVAAPDTLSGVEGHTLIHAPGYFVPFPFVTPVIQPLPVSTLIDLFRVTARRKFLNNQIGTSNLYKTTLNSLVAYQPELQFKHITVSLLNSYEQWMLKQEASLNTVGAYMRYLRAIYRLGIKGKLVSPENYPFGQDGYIIPNIRKNNISLETHHIENIQNCTVTCTQEAIARDYWLISYFGNGLNIMDLALLKFRNWEGDLITIPRRAKTAKTAKNEILPIVIVVRDQLLELIQRRCNKRTSADGYVFPILQEGMTAKQIKETVRCFIKQINVYMYQIGERIQLPMPANTKKARSSWATHMKEMGASTEEIQEGLGHASPQTTRFYMGSFPNERKVAFATRFMAAVKKKVS